MKYIFFRQTKSARGTNSKIMGTKIMKKEVLQVER